MQLAEIFDSDMTAANENARRTRAHGRALRHSARVRLLRRIIPITAGTAALAIAGLVLYSPFADDIPNVSVGSVSVSGTKVTMENPKMSGFRKGERGYEVTATAALQDVRKPSLIELQGMKGHIATNEKGDLAYLEAKNGFFDSGQESMTLEQDIRVWTDKGEEARLKSASVEFKTGSVKSSDSVVVTVPSGSITADSLDIVDNGKRISFVGNVHALFHAQDKARPESVDNAAERVRTSSAESSEAQR